MKKESHTYNINRPRAKHKHKHRKYKKCLRMVMIICIKQQLSNLRSSLHEKVKQYRGWVEKRVAYKKKRVIKVDLPQELITDSLKYLVYIINLPRSETI